MLIPQETGWSNTSFASYGLQRDFHRIWFIAWCWVFTENFNAFLRVWTNFTSTRFLIFSICFPITELLINLKNSSQIHSLLLRAASCWAQCISSAKALLWSLFPDEPFWSSNLGLNIVWGSYDEWYFSLSLRSKWIVVMQVIRLFWIFKIYLKNARNISPIVEVSHTRETSDRMRLAHCPSKKSYLHQDWWCIFVGFISS